jgi:hypothetical protein
MDDLINAIIIIVGIILIAAASYFLIEFLMQYDECDQILKYTTIDCDSPIITLD